MAKTSKRTSGSRKRSPARRSLKQTSGPTLVESVQPAVVAFAKLARRERLRWYVFGAQAVAFYGVQRASADIDITVDLGDRKLASLLKPLSTAGFTSRFSDPEFAAATHVCPVVHDESGWPIDLVIAGPGIEQIFLEHARIHHVAGQRVPVIAPEHLIVTKLLAQRPKDLEDIRSILRIADIDHSVVEQLLAALEDALGQSDLRPLYARLRDA